MTNDLNKKIKSGFIWKFLERASIQVFTFIIQIVLARILFPEDFGELAIILSFINLAHTFIYSGLGLSLIQKKDSDELDNNTVFWTVLFLAILFYLLLFIFSNQFAKLFSINNFSSLLKVGSLVIVIDSLYIIHSTLLRKNLIFKKYFVVNLISSIIYGVLTIVLAYLGYGVWSLIIGVLAQKFSTLLILWLIVKWRPKLLFSFARLKQLFFYSWKLTIAWIIGNVHNDIYTFVIGINFSESTLGYYSKSQTIPSAVQKTLNETIPNVLFPAFSVIQNDLVLLKNYLRKTTSTFTFLTFPIFLGIAALAEPIVLVLFTDRWATIIPLMRIYVFSILFTLISNINMQSFNAIGRSDIFLKFELIKRPISILLILILSRISIEAVMYGILGVSVLSYGLNMIASKKLIDYKIKEQLNDILPNLFLSAIMFIIVTISIRDISNVYYNLIIGSLIGIISYTSLTLLFRKRQFNEILRLLKNILRKKKNG